jgi:endogenous inhibitor of DNA gyrase (YacG/DUF329 family)
MTMSDPVGAPAKCPICGNATVVAYRPFCSRRCADVDLGRWFTGGYAIAGDDADDNSDEGEAAQSDKREKS